MPTSKTQSATGWQPQMRELLRQLGPTPLRVLASLLDIPYETISSNIHSIAARGTIRLTQPSRGHIIVELEPWAEDEAAVLAEMETRRNRGLSVSPVRQPPRREDEGDPLVRQALCHLWAESDLFLTLNNNIAAAWPGGPAPRWAIFIGRFRPDVSKTALRIAIAAARKKRDVPCK